MKKTNTPREDIWHGESAYIQNEKGNQKFLGAYWLLWLWIDSFAQKTKALYIKMLEEEPNPLIWTPEETQTIEEIKQALIAVPILALPSLEKPFHLFVTVDQGVALGMLTPRGDNLWPSFSSSLTHFQRMA